MRDVRRGVGVGEPPVFGCYGDERVVDRVAHLRPTTDKDDATTLLNRGPYCRAVLSQQVLDVNALSRVIPRERRVELREDAAARPVEQLVLINEVLRAPLRACAVCVAERVEERGGVE